LPCLFERHCVRAVRIFLAPKRAQPTGSNADIRRIDVAIDVEKCRIAPHALAHMIRKPADSENIRGTIQRQTIFETQALGREYLFGNWAKPCILSLESMPSRRNADRSRRLERCGH